jgi:predicted permease
MLHELGPSIRGLVRAPAHSAIVVLTMALGIGATATIASVVNGVLLRPLPFRNAERLMMLWQRAPGVGVEEDWLSPAQYFDLREKARGFEELAMVFGTNVTLTGDGVEPERLGALNVSSSFFDLFGIEPVLGRRLTPEDDLPGSAVKVLLSESLFQRRFRGDPAVLGRTIEVDGKPLEVTGVLPPLPLDEDLLPTLNTVPVFDLVTSLPIEDPGITTHGSENYNVIGRLAPPTTKAELEAELLRVAEGVVQDPQSLGAGLTSGTEYRIDAVSLLDQVVGPVRSPLLLLLGATGVLLLIACANVANLVLTRAATRSRELALRAAIGASRSRLIRDAMIPNLLLGLFAGALGLLLAAEAIAVLRRVAPPDLPRLAEIAIDPRILAFAIAISLASSVLFGLVPALRFSEVSPTEALREGAAAVRARSLWRGGSRYFVIVQVALSLVLATGAGLLLRTFFELRSTPPGFRPEGTLTFRVSLVGERYEDRAARDRFFELLFDRIRGGAGVSEAGGISMLPLTRGFAWTDFLVQDQQDPERNRVVADVHVVTPGYFEAMGIPLLSGRTFTNADDGEPLEVVVNRALAERFWRVEDAVGKWVGRGPEERATILGVVENVKHYGLGTEPHMTVFFPYEAYASRTLYGVAHGPGGAESIAPRVIEAVRALDPQIPVYDSRTMGKRVSDSLARERVLMMLLLLFSGIAVTLATVGLYGVLSFTVATHTRELGIRKAVGASRRDLYRHVLRGALAVVGIGIALGLAAALFASRLIQGLLYGVGASDPLTLGAAAALLLAVGLGASMLPARRAAGIDPVIALKM